MNNIRTMFYRMRERAVSCGCGFLDCFAALAMTVIALRRDKQVGFAEINKLPCGEINKPRGAKRRGNPEDNAANRFGKTAARLSLVALALVCAIGAATVIFAQGDGSVDEPPVGAQDKEETVYTPFGAYSAPAASGKSSSPHWSAAVAFFGESDWTFVAQITVRFLMNIIFAYILICYIFAKEHRIKEYSFSFFISNILIFMVTSLLASVKVKTGFAFGLFAILSILRYRTEQIQIREMTFLFAAIIMGVINSLATDGLTIFAVLLADVLLCVSIAICDAAFMGVTDQILLVYDNTALLAKEKKKELHEDIKNRFGYDVVKVVVTKMNYLTDSAEVKLVYKRS